MMEPCHAHGRPMGRAAGYYIGTAPPSAPAENTILCLACSAGLCYVLIAYINAYVKVRTTTAYGKGMPAGMAGCVAAAVMLLCGCQAGPAKWQAGPALTCCMAGEGKCAVDLIMHQCSYIAPIQNTSPAALHCSPQLVIHICTMRALDRPPQARQVPRRLRH